MIDVDRKVGKQVSTTKTKRGQITRSPRALSVVGRQVSTTKTKRWWVTRSPISLSVVFLKSFRQVYHMSDDYRVQNECFFELFYSTSRGVPPQLSAVHPAAPDSSPSLQSTLFSIYTVQIVYLSLGMECEKNENKQKEAAIGPFF